jgi:FdhD protein
MVTPSNPPAEHTHSSQLTVQVQRHRHNETSTHTDQVAEECPVALVFNGISHAVMMATPENLDLFALGFALSEGVIETADQVRDIEVLSHPEGMEIRLEIAQSSFVELKAHRRALSGRTGCGVCGIESIELLDLQPESVQITPAQSEVDQQCLSRILAELPKHQPLTQATGCAHAAAWCDLDGNILQVFEDVGRHNALDKLLGWMARNRIDVTSGLVFLTSRASYELVRKSARCQIALLATISAPTSLAISIAHQAGIRLLSFCRPGSFVAY